MRFVALKNRTIPPPPQMRDVRSSWQYRIRELYPANEQPPKSPRPTRVGVRSERRASVEGRRDTYLVCGHGVRTVVWRREFAGRTGGHDRRLVCTPVTRNGTENAVRPVDTMGFPVRTSATGGTVR